MLAGWVVANRHSSRNLAHVHLPNSKQVLPSGLGIIPVLVFTVFFVLFRLSIFILICFVCTSVSTTATERQLIAVSSRSNNNNNNEVNFPGGKAAGVQSLQLTFI
jgi:hypothetical protein